MTLLCFDTSSASTVVAGATGTRTVVRRHDPVGRERPAHTTAALPLAAEILAELGADWRDFDRVGVGIGPGSFTGLRSGVSAAAGLARRLDVPLVGVTTTQQVAHAARAALGTETPILVVIDGRRRELFVERFDPAADDPARPGAGITVVGRDDVAALGSLDGWLVVGDGALLERDALIATGAQVPPVGDALHLVDGHALAALTRAGTARAADEVRPAYGRGADAVPTADRPVKPIPGGPAPADPAVGP